MAKTIDPRTIYQGAGTKPLIECYRGAYDAAFIAFHPFRDVTGMASPAAALLRQMGAGSGTDEPYDLVAELYTFGRESSARPKELWRDIYRIEREFGRSVSWTAVCAEAGFNTARLNRALLTGIGALISRYADPEANDRLERCCNDMSVFRPTEGMFQPRMQRDIGRIFASAGVERVECGDEFGETAIEVALDELTGPEPWDFLSFDIRNTSRNLFASDRSLLISVEFDSFFTLICGTRERLEKVPLSGIFDGFWCDATTSDLWWMTPEEQRAIDSEA